MTPSMGMAAPKGMEAAPQAGLAALAKPNTQARGKSPENMGQIMSLARKMSDAQLADVLQGKSLDVPQFAAMTEAMGRRSLRTAVQGAQAQQQAVKPNLKNKFLADEAAQQMAQATPIADQMEAPPQMMAEGGIAELPAPNMESLDMAGGGIVAFDGGGPVSKDQLQAAYEEWQNSKGPWYLPTPAASGSKQKEAAYVDMLKEYQKTQGMALPKAATPAIAAAPALAPVDTGAKPDSLGRYVANADAPPAAAPAGGGAARSAGPDGMPSYDQLLKQKTADYLAKLEGMGDKKRAGLSELKDQIGSQAALQLSSALLGSRNLAEAGSKFGQQAASTLSAGRAEKRQIENAADEMDVNLAKAREAAEKGDMALALQYTQLANTNKYQMGSLDVQRGRNAILGEGTQLGKVQLGLANADKQAYNEAKTKFGDLPMNKKNQAAFDAFVAQRSKQLKMQNPLTKQYADLGGSDLGSKPFNTVQSLPRGASVVDLES